MDHGHTTENKWTSHIQPQIYFQLVKAKHGWLSYDNRKFMTGPPALVFFSPQTSFVTLRKSEKFNKPETHYNVMVFGIRDEPSYNKAAM